jgi:hypothetical protein
MAPPPLWRQRLFCDSFSSSFAFFQFLPLISATTRYLPDASTAPGIHASPSAAMVHRGSGKRKEKEDASFPSFSLECQKEKKRKKSERRSSRFQCDGRRAARSRGRHLRAASQTRSSLVFRLPSFLLLLCLFFSLFSSRRGHGGEIDVKERARGSELEKQVESEREQDQNKEREKEKTGFVFLFRTKQHWFFFDTFLEWGKEKKAELQKRGGAIFEEGSRERRKESARARGEERERDRGRFSFLSRSLDLERARATPSFHFSKNAPLFSKQLSLSPSSARNQAIFRERDPFFSS